MSVEQSAAVAPSAPSSSWADEVEDESKAVESLSEKVAKSLDLDVQGAPDLHSGELMVREAGCPEGQHKTQPVTSFAALNIDDDVKKAIAEVKGWSSMSKIQQIGLPLVLNDPPLNLIGQAQAGTGKTGTFVIGMLARISAQRKPSTPQAIILCVSQELCTQIAQEVNSLGAAKGINARRIMSSRSKGSEPGATTEWELKTGEDFDEQVVVGTVGSVKNYLANAEGRKKKKPMIDASDCKVLILDEADKMVQAPPNGFGDAVVQIRDMIMKKRKGQPCQLLLFSATFTEEIRQVAQRFVGGDSNDMTKYHEIVLRKQDVTLEKVVNFFALVGDPNETSADKLYQEKFNKITEIWSSLSAYNLGQTVIFCNTKRMVQRLADFLRQQGFDVGQIHGDMEKSERDTVLKEFKSGQRQALVSTNVTSRGIDNPNVTLVINVDLPTDVNNQPDPENFVHRIGRSGRWTKKGASVSLVARSSRFPDLNCMREIEKALFANQEVDRPLVQIDDLSTLGEKLENLLNAIK